MITEIKLLKFFVLQMILQRILMVRWQKKSLPSTTDTPNGKEAHDVGCRGHPRSDPGFHSIVPKLQHYYLDVCAFTGSICFRRHFLQPLRWRYAPMFLWLMTMVLRLACFGECARDKFCGQTCHSVIHNKRRFSMRYSRICCQRRVHWMGMSASNCICYA